jgi:hypothetical protein
MAAPLTQLQRINAMEAFHTNDYQRNVLKVPYSQNTPEGNEVPPWAPAVAGGPPAPAAGCIYGGGTHLFANIRNHPYRMPHLGHASTTAGVDAALPMARRAILEFDLLVCPWDATMTWRQKKDVALEHIWWLSGRLPHWRVFKNKKITGSSKGAKLQNSIPAYFHSCMALAIASFAYETEQRTRPAATLRLMGNPYFDPTLRDGGPDYLQARDVNCCFVRPLLLFAKEVLSKPHRTYMNNPVLNIRDVYNKTIPTIFHDYQDKLRMGVWSETWIRLNPGTVRPETCKGMYFPYARFMQLFDPDFEYDHECEFLTPEQVLDLRRTLSAAMIHRYNNDAFN